MIGAIPNVDFSNNICCCLFQCHLRESLYRNLNDVLLKVYRVEVPVFSVFCLFFNSTYKHTCIPPYYSRKLRDFINGSQLAKLKKSIPLILSNKIYMAVPFGLKNYNYT